MMYCEVKKRLTTSRECHYGISIDPSYLVVGKRKYTFFRNRFDLYWQGALQYTLMQDGSIWHRIRHAISVLPLLNLLYENPFYFYRNGVVCGQSKPLTRPFGMGKWDFYFENSVYRVTVCSDGSHYTLEKDGVEVATYQKHFEKENGKILIDRGPDKGKYSISYTEGIASRPDILLLFAAYVENYICMKDC